MTVLVDHCTSTVHREAPDGVSCDGLPRHAAGPRFDFAQTNRPVWWAGPTRSRSSRSCLTWSACWCAETCT